MKKILLLLLIMASPIILYLFFGVCFEGDQRWMLSLTLTSIFTVSLVLHKTSYFRNFKSVLIFHITPIFLLFLVSIFFISWIYLSPYLILMPLAAYLGWLSTSKQLFLKSALSIVLFLGLGFIGFPNLIQESNNLNARVSFKYKPINLSNYNGDSIVLDKSKIIVLDFWNTSCSICFEQFPHIESVFKKFKSNPNVNLYSVNVPLKRDNLPETKKLVKKLGYQFPTLYAQAIEDVENLGIYSYPNILIVKDGQVRFSGNFVINKSISFGSLEEEINFLLNEE